MKRMSKILSFVIAVAVCLSILPFNTLAAGSASIAFSKQNPTVGDTVTVTVTVSATDMYGVNVSGSYNEEVLTYISGASSGGAGLFQIADSENFNGESSKSFTLTFKAKKAGTSSISIKGQVASGIPPADVDVSSSANFSVKDVTLSNNANLSSLRTSAGSLSPRFSQNVTEYTVNVKNSVTECKVYGTTADPNATIGIVGSATLKVGQNKRVLTVTAPSGAQKSYTLTIIRSEVEEPEETVSDTSSVSETSAALETIIDGVSYMVLQDISSVELPVGFNVTKRLYNNEEVSVAIDEKENYELFYLKSADSDIAVPYTFDDAKNLFKKVNIITQGSNSYIVAEIPEDLTVPDDFTAKTVKIQDISIAGYISTDTKLKDMYYVYCYFGGDYNVYRYDSVENVLQRCPEFQLISDEKVATSTSNIEFLNRFNTLSTNAKTVVVCLVIAFFGVIVLSVLVIIKLVKRGKSDDFDLEDDENLEDFESIKFDDDFEMVSDGENTEE